ncbi:hypothetical protein [Schlesneria paludicola]|uniref:hypothetical protein n=1 Tax=Schlesneria paludicola TaxID=360056 RepID=UPI0012FBEA0C|nr:hypothetical protein [Schlesneria paludicola]
MPKSERVAILEMLAKQMISNYEQIKTWRGSYTFVDAQYSSDVNQSLRENQKNPGLYDQLYSPVALSAEVVAPLQLQSEKRKGHWFILEGKIDFVLDSGSQREYVRMLREPRTDFVDIPTGVQIRQNRGQGSYYYLYAPNSFTELYTQKRIGPITGHAIVDGVPAGRLVSVRPVDKAGSRSSDFDCRALFGGPRNGLVRKEAGFWPRLKLTADALSGKASATPVEAETVRLKWDAIVRIYVSDGSDPIYTIVLGDPLNRHTVTRFDSKSGFNWISFANRDGKSTLDSKTATYRCIDGVFVPETYEQRSVNVDQSPTDVILIRTLRLSETTLNSTVSDSDFSVYQFDLKYCDRMLDEIKDELYVYDDLMRKFVIAEKFSFDSSRTLER